MGNFSLSFRPKITDDMTNPKKSLLVEWSDDLKGGKVVRISGVFDKLSYKVRKAFSVEPVKYSFSTTHCSLKYEDGRVADLHFLIHSIVRDVPVIKPDKDSPVASQEQREIFLLPTVRVFNLLQADIHVLLTDMDPSAAIGCENIGNQATIPCGSPSNMAAAALFYILTSDDHSILKRGRQREAFPNYISIPIAGPRFPTSYIWTLQLVLDFLTREINPITLLET